MSISASALVLLFVVAATGPAPAYPWLHAAPSSSSSLIARIASPAGFARVPVEPGSFGAFLRRLPLLPPGAPVLSYREEALAAPAYAVVDLDVGKRDLQQCADSVIRLYAEHQFAKGRASDVAFHFTNGDLARFERWSEGWRPHLQKQNRVTWTKDAAPDESHASLRKYLDVVFMWAGTASLARHTPRALGDVQPGDFFLLGGSPGHAVLVLDVARDNDGSARLLLGQGFMPAQSFHVLRAPDGSAWFPYDGSPLKTPSWPAPFPRDSLRRFD